MRLPARRTRSVAFFEHHRERHCRRMAKTKPHLKLEKDLYTLLSTLVSQANRSISRNEFFEATFRLLMPILKCDGVEVQLLARDKLIRCEANKQKGGFHAFSVSQVKSGASEEHPHASGENPGLDQLSRYLLGEDRSLKGRCITKNGSFFTRGNQKHYEITPTRGPDMRPYLFHLEGIYPSFAVIPLRADEMKLGVLQLKSKKAGAFNKKNMGFYESVAQTISLALLDRERLASLRERIKELDCLYSISKIIDQSGLTLDNILKEILELLPSAWSSQNDAAARIVLDNSTYTTAGYEDSDQRQSADIIVDGRCRGTVEVVYLRPMPERDEGPFLIEERHLIDAVAKQIAFIFERKQGEQQQQILQEQLRHADRLAKIGQFSAGIAHELNEPLANILGFAQLAGDCAGLPEQAAKDIDKILKASLFAREIVKKLLLFSRQMPQKKTSVNLNQLVQEVLSFLESRIAKANVIITCNLDPDLPDIMADAGQLQQVLINLVVNAIQAMPLGGTLKVETRSRDDDMAFIVEDNGVGMNEDTQKKLFTPFFTTKDIDKGTGLGLPVVYGIVNSHGGTIQVSSRPEHGSRFEISLPLTKQGHTG